MPNTQSRHDMSGVSLSRLAHPRLLSPKLVTFYQQCKRNLTLATFRLMNKYNFEHKLSVPSSKLEHLKKSPFLTQCTQSCFKSYFFSNYLKNAIISRTKTNPLQITSSSAFLAASAASFSFFIFFAYSCFEAPPIFPTANVLFPYICQINTNTIR